MVLVAGAAIACHRFVPESPVRSGGRINWLAATLLAVWLLALLLPVSQGQEWGWTSALTIALLAVAAVAFVVWAVVESTSNNPVVDMRMMRLRAVWTTNLVALLFGAAMFATLTFLPQFMQTPTTAGYGFGASVTIAGLLFLPLLVTMAIGGMASGPMHARIDFKAQVALGSALLAIGSFGFALWNDQQWQVAVFGAIFGMGLGLAYSATTGLIVQNVAPAQTGIATGMNTNIRNIGGAIGTAVVTALVTSSAHGDGLPTSDGYRDGFLVLAIASVVAAAVTALMPARSAPMQQ